MSAKRLILGNDALGLASRAAGATAFFGYPITPSSEIAHYWARLANAQLMDSPVKPGNDMVESGDDRVESGNDRAGKYVFLQAEDETGAGFMLVGAVLAGVKALTATGGPGHVLMQDALSMAEAMRLPVVVYAMQRGGPSTSTVIYSQQEVTLACFGGNGNGYRVVYSPATPQDLYDYGIKAFNTAWRHRFPTILLGDGYLGKMTAEVEIYDPAERGLALEPAEPYLLAGERRRPVADFMPSPEFDERESDGHKYACYRNCLNTEAEALAVNTEIAQAFAAAAPAIVESAEYGPADAPTLVIAHGIVAAAARAAAESPEAAGRLRVFRPITLRPFPVEELRRAAAGASRLVVAESADNQLGQMVRDALCGHVAVPVEGYCRPSHGILPEEILAL
jgi:2-oxoglutarate ferredoxin oxidoreductase subunit alpha